MIDVHWTEVDQVITVWTDAPAPLRAGLYFRTGRADETLATAGLTHLLEHLALSTMSDPTKLNNGFVGGAVTGFISMGQPEDVSSFLTNLCNALNSLPGDRLDSEKQVLEAENATRQYDYCSNLLNWRYGAAGYGLLRLPELGLQKITLEQLQNHAAQRFTRKNAILWLSGPLPENLRLPLPDGIKHPIPPPTPIQQTLPCWFVDDLCGGVAAGITVPRVYAAPIFCEMASRRLHKRLRTDQAVSYAPSFFYDPLNSEIAHLVLYADSDKNRRAELANAFGEVFQEFNTIEDAEIESVINQFVERFTGPLAPPPADRKVIEVQRAAMAWILGHEYESLEYVASQYNAVTVEEVASFGSYVQANAMFALPGEARLLPGFGKMAPVSIAPVVRGPWAIHMDSPVRPEKLVYSPDGVSLLLPDGSHYTVRFSELAAALCYEDGGVHLIGSDAVSIMVEPTLWRDGQNISSRIREQVPEHLRIDRGPRPADTIPKPTTTAWQRFREKFNVRTR
jgi:hypothetical protein